MYRCVWEYVTDLGVREWGTGLRRDGMRFDGGRGVRPVAVAVASLFGGNGSGGCCTAQGSARRATLAPPHPDTRQKQRQNTQPPTQWRTRAQHTTAPQHTSTAPHPTTSCVLLHVARGHRLHRATTPPAQHPACTTWLDRRSEIKSPRPHAKITSVTHSPLWRRRPPVAGGAAPANSAGRCVFCLGCQTTRGRRLVL